PLASSAVDEDTFVGPSEDEHVDEPAVAPPVPEERPRPYAPASGGLIDSLPWNVPDIRAGDAAPTPLVTQVASPGADSVDEVSGVEALQRPAANVPPTVPANVPPTVPANVPPTAFVHPDPDVEIEGDHDGSTVLVSHLRAAYQEDAAAAVEGHAADSTLIPGMTDMALYDEPEPSAEPVPGLVLAVSSGPRVVLDRPVLIGRAPESSRFAGNSAPRLVTVPSPQQDISRTHVEVRLEGGGVIVTDLGSTNGTVVEIPDSDPRRLHPGEGVPVPVGTLIDLGDGITVLVEETTHPHTGGTS
ncbi:MAG: FHA domain-containing protein, partial [Actinomycetales bacterium]|nr:FHA domain-containing protein [Actinomycetales bacterium]